MAWGSAGCGGKDPELLTRTVRVYSLPACPAPATGELTLEALGPFAATNLTAEVLAIDDRRELRFPPETQAIAAQARSDASSYVGYGEVTADADPI